MPIPPPPPAELAKALHAAREARTKAYAPYSNYQVGAAVLTHDGQIITGCNIEIPSWEESTCAERVAIGSAVTLGHAGQRLDFIRLVAVSTQSAAENMPCTLMSPCGACRQVINEFANPLECTIVMDDGQQGISLSLDDLLKHGFRFNRAVEAKAPLACAPLEQQAVENQQADTLLEIARQMRANAGDQVKGLTEGAVIITTSNQAFVGTSLENSCTPLTMRALRVAVNRAAATGLAQATPAFIKRAALALPKRGRNDRLSLRQSINPALVAEFFTDDAVLDVQLDGAKPFSLYAADLFGWTKNIL